MSAVTWRWKPKDKLQPPPLKQRTGKHCAEQAPGGVGHIVEPHIQGYPILAGITDNQKTVQRRVHRKQGTE